jgi:hypothetical protein
MDIMAVKVASTREGVGGGANFGWIFDLLVGLEEAWHTDILRSWSRIIRKKAIKGQRSEIRTNAGWGSSFPTTPKEHFFLPSKINSLQVVDLCQKSPENDVFLPISTGQSRFNAQNRDVAPQPALVEVCGLPPLYVSR